MKMFVENFHDPMSLKDAQTGKKPVCHSQEYRKLTSWEELNKAMLNFANNMGHTVIKNTITDGAQEKWFGWFANNFDKMAHFVRFAIVDVDEYEIVG